MTVQRNNKSARSQLDEGNTVRATTADIAAEPIAIAYFTIIGHFRIRERADVVVIIFHRLLTTNSACGDAPKPIYNTCERNARILGEVD
ncbi:hypothetical protein [Bradyrhizobium canariense]|uniref:hypothetical protein n=1 Tax=Bradyrhizobium canariense TaxID=255045 RepID=UPI001178058B|nr:hypothetical protein [Bradyrhizobium canariense]